MKVEHLGSSGLRLLLDAQAWARRHGRRFVVVVVVLVVVAPDGAVGRLLGLTTLADRVEVVQDLAALRS